MEMKPLSDKDISKILELKKHLKKEKFSAVDAASVTGTGAIAMNLVSTLDSVEFMPVFDYQQWLESVDFAGPSESYISNPDVLKSADLNTLRKIMTANVRIGRFSGGHLENLIENGYISALLERIEELSKE